MRTHNLSRPHLACSVSSHKKKMMCRILLLLMLTCCVCAGTFEVNVTQSFYQAEENQSIMLEWSFTPQDGRSLHSLCMLCLMVTDHKVSRLFELMGGVEVPAPEHKHFAGRVHCDKDVLKEGRLRLHVSSLRTEDSGQYVCDMKMKYDASRGECSLNMTAASHEPETQRPTGRPGTESRGRPGLYAGLELLAASAGLALCVMGGSRQVPTGASVPVTMGLVPPVATPPKGRSPLVFDSTTGLTI
ncbi:uncharacterized protein [Labrus bergylta]|uniref:uncharacterized protein n=1 Tax=Labrus bergylta TaxID=56723 RepID=UPI00331345FB